MLAVLRLWVGLLLVVPMAFGCAAQIEDSGEAHESLEPRRTLTVDSFADESDVHHGDGICETALGTCTLRAAVEEASTYANADTIVLPAGHYSINEVLVLSHLRLIGIGQPIIDGGDQTPVLSIRHAAEVRGVTIQRGRADTGDNGFALASGGGVLVERGASATLERCVVAGNSAVFGGGGIYVSSDASLLLRGSSVRGNYSSYGGGIAASHANITIEKSAIVGNIALDEGGGFSSYNTFTEIYDSTISANYGDSGGGIYQTGTWRYLYTTKIVRSTIAFNLAGRNLDRLPGDDERPAGGGIFAEEGRVELESSIVAANSDFLPGEDPLYAPDCASTGYGHYRSRGHNLLGTMVNGTFQSDPSDLMGTAVYPLDPGLEPLAAWNDRETEVHRLMDNSPARGNGLECPVDSCDIEDQHGSARASEAHPRIDIGAYEVRGSYTYQSSRELAVSSSDDRPRGFAYRYAP